MEHLEVSFTVAYILIIEPAILGDMSGDRSDLFNCSSFVIPPPLFCFKHQPYMLHRGSQAWTHDSSTVGWAPQPSSCQVDVWITVFVKRQVISTSVSVSGHSWLEKSIVKWHTMQWNLFLYFLFCQNTLCLVAWYSSCLNFSHSNPWLLGLEWWLAGLCLNSFNEFKNISTIPDLNDSFAFIWR